jgi:hypothetical protein
VETVGVGKEGLGLWREASLEAHAQHAAWLARKEVMGLAAGCACRSLMLFAPLSHISPKHPLYTRL